MNYYLVYQTDAGRTVHKFEDENIRNMSEAEVYGKSWCECMGLEFIEVYKEDY